MEFGSKYRSITLRYSYKGLTHGSLLRSKRTRGERLGFDQPEILVCIKAAQ